MIRHFVADEYVKDVFQIDLVKLKNEGKLRPYLVFALGDNKGWTQAMMDKFLRLVGNDTKVILVTFGLLIASFSTIFPTNA